MTNLKQQMEVLADIEHQRWSHWQKYMHSKMVEHSDGKGEWMCLPVELFHQWERQIATEYADLSEAEKQSDRDQVERYLPAIKTLMSEIINSTPLPHEPSITTTDLKSGVGGNYVVNKDWHDPATLTHEEIQTLISQIIADTKREERERILAELPHLRQITVKGEGLYVHQEAVKGAVENWKNYKKVFHEEKDI